MQVLAVVVVVFVSVQVLYFPTRSHKRPRAELNQTCATTYLGKARARHKSSQGKYVPLWADGGKGFPNRLGGD